MRSKQPLFSPTVSSQRPQKAHNSPPLLQSYNRKVTTKALGEQIAKIDHSSFVGDNKGIGRTDSKDRST
ncbi:hypothetical protein HHK36_007954 [Tetracentron sinense]|uniref:Uncharacterized protein n=1 Tax=Tetracentron sinense TaxID=13715 RepID=A0A834ZLI6_TETSI|nr:hypothetical protein HHK36_007954 [Tetracentron sinense]